MKHMILLLIILNLGSSLYSQPFYFGVEGTFGTSIGTGKGYWDWTDSSRNIKRLAPANAGFALMMLADLGQVFQLETGVGYYWNICELIYGDEHWVYRQESLEIPLGLRLFFNTDKRGLYAKGGTALILLTGKPSFKNEKSGEELFESHKAENKAHAGLQVGIGYEKNSKNILWAVEGEYITFYTSPDYKRSDGSTADTRFHRFSLNFSLFFR